MELPPLQWVPLEQRGICLPQVSAVMRSADISTCLNVDIANHDTMSPEMMMLMNEANKKRLRIQAGKEKGTLTELDRWLLKKAHEMKDRAFRTPPPLYKDCSLLDKFDGLVRYAIGEYLQIDPNLFPMIGIHTHDHAILLGDILQDLHENLQRRGPLNQKTRQLLKDLWRQCRGAVCETAIGRERVMLTKVAKAMEEYLAHEVAVVGLGPDVRGWALCRAKPAVHAHKGDAVHAGLR